MVGILIKTFLIALFKKKIIKVKRYGNNISINIAGVSHTHINI